ncbi:MAG: hypothetical protein AABY06_02530 [Nanoarchaeota archaeon]
MTSQKSKHISEFNEGDIITRVEPAIHYKKIYDEILKKEIIIDSLKDSSFMEVPLEYSKIVKDKIYFKWVSKDNLFEKGEIIELNYNKSQNGWVKYIDKYKSQKICKDKFLEKNLENLFKFSQTSSNFKMN